MRDIEEKREKLHLLQTLPESKPSEAIHLNPSSSFTRPPSPSPTSPWYPDVSNEDPSSSTSSSCSPPKPGSPPQSPWAPLTNRDYAVEFKRRCQVLSRMRHAAQEGGFNLGSSRPASPRLMSFTPTRGRTKLSEPDELTQTFWTCYLMLLENDGKNLPHLLEYACLRDYMRLFHRHSLLAEALNPGWPRQTAGRALGLWIGWLGGDDLATETASESEQKFFVLKPYVFAAHKFDAFLAPWTIPSLPVTHEDYPVLPPPAGPYLADLRPRSGAQTIVHMGRKIDLSPPNLAHAAIFSFFFRVEQDPAVQDDLLTHATGTPAMSHGGAAGVGFGGGGGSVAGLGGLTAHSRPTKTSLPTLSSRVHDRDFVRLASCIDPYTSRGMPSLYTKGDLAGNWEGRFSFFDFDSYRDMLGGRMRSLYEGPFGDQPQVWKLEETVVKIDRANGDRPGGTGPALNAGYDINVASQVRPGLGRPTASSPTVLPTSSTSRLALSQSPPPGPRRRRTSSNGASLEAVVLEDLDPHDDVAAERASKRLKKKSDSLAGASGPLPDMFWEDDEVDEEARRRAEALEEGDYEILLSGSGHSAWGQFNLKGRVRAWDGMFTIIKEYTPDSRGRWIYRGYRIGDSLVGRWRDTHTPIDMSGYEGTWSMNRRV
ncbi:hypothetical protein JCM10212_001376, partial [Sporobolomyces blumeae]